MKARLGLLVAVVGAGAVALSAAAQGSAKLAVGPDAGGYLCPDGRQLYVKSCYDDLPDANCGVLSLDRWTTGTLRVQAQATKTRSDVQKEVSGCKLYPVAFDNGVVSLVLPKQQAAQALPPAAPPVAAPPAAGQYNAGASSGASARMALVRISAGDGDWQYVDELSIRPSSQKGLIEIRQLTVTAAGRAGKPGVTAIWRQFFVNCKTASRSLQTATTLNHTGAIVETMGGDQVWNAVANGSVGASVVSAACNPASLKGLRFSSVGTATADAAMLSRDVMIPGPATALVRISINSGIVHYVDEKTVKPATADGVGEVWAMQVFTKPSAGFPKASAVWARHLVRCSPGRTHLATFVQLDKAGKALGATSLTEDEPAIAAKGSIDEVTASFACQQPRPKGQRFATVGAAIADAANPQ